MHVYDLTFVDGKQCRHIVPQPQETEEEELRITQAIFCGRLKSMVRIIAPPPERLPWARDGGKWRIGNFELMKNTANDEFILSWPGGALVSKSKDEISAAVRTNWSLGI